MLKEFKTLAGSGTFELTEKKSRFLGYADCVENAEEAEKFVKNIQRKHPDARHCVYAYTVGGLNGDAEVKRMSDDGEPQGTGGIPCLDVFTKKDLRFAAVAVVRYFGGILLGAPGLVRAYGKAAAGAVLNAEECIMRRCRRVTVSADYQLYGKLSRAADSSGYEKESPVFGENVSFSLIIPEDEAEAYANHLRNISSCRAGITVSGETFFKKRV